MINKVILMGRMTRDPELKYTPDRTPVCSFTIAWSKSFKGRDGSKKDKKGFFDVTMFGRKGEVIAEYFTKGSRILVEGELDHQTWDDKTTGQKRYRISILGTEFDFIDSKKEGDKQAEQAPQGVEESSEWNSEPTFAGDQDVPF